MNNGKGKKKVTKLQQDFLDILVNKALNVSEACKACNIDRKTYYNWCKNPEFKELVDICAEGEKDWVEGQMKLLMKGIANVEIDPKTGKSIIAGWRTPPNATMLIWWSKSKMPERGFTDKERENADTTITLKHEFLDGKSDDVDLSL